ncbi:hypothetical protein SCALM49S_04420 [Streptomyces californicus]
MEISEAVPSRRTVGFASPITARLSRVFLARHSWMMPMPVLATITKPKRLSWIGATNSMITQSTPMIRLNRVKTLARTISTTEREDRTGTSLTSPRATRSATSAVVSPSGRCAGGGGSTGCTGSSSAPASILACRGFPEVREFPGGCSPGPGVCPPEESSARCVMGPTLRASVGNHPPGGVKIRPRVEEVGPEVVRGGPRRVRKREGAPARTEARVARTEAPWP